MADIILITGMPGCGKTTLLNEVICDSDLRFYGFFTDEIRKNNKREGFRVRFTDGDHVVLARKSIRSDFKVGKYGIDLKKFEKMLEKKKMNIISSDFVVIDEIGKMELFSYKFREIIESLFDSCNLLLGSIIYKPHPYADIIKQRDDVRIFELDKSNYINIKVKIVNILKTYKQNQPNG
jgi:nucleoside-triphosphatase